MKYNKRQTAKGSHNKYLWLKILCHVMWINDRTNIYYQQDVGIRTVDV